MNHLSTPIPGPLALARFVDRPNRFLLQVRLEDTGELVEAHMADPGRLRELLFPQKRIWVRPATNSARKTRWSAVLVEAPGGDELVSLDSTLPNRLILNALQNNALPEFAGWDFVRAEATLGRSRFDFLLGGADGRKLILEVKSVTMVEEGVGFFPDAVTARGARHVSELGHLAQQRQWEAAVLFVLQRSDAHEVRAAREIDPKFADSLAEAQAAGVRVLGRRCRVFHDRMELGEPIPVGIV
jgi:sugar fermentation stimulation protein A